MRDKVPKGDFVIRAGMMDRLVENKLYNKCVEYGERVRKQRLVGKEKEKMGKECKTWQSLVTRLPTRR